MGPKSGKASNPSNENIYATIDGSHFFIDKGPHAVRPEPLGESQDTQRSIISRNEFLCTSHEVSRVRLSYYQHVERSKGVSGQDGPFTYETWIEWHENMHTYLQGMLNITKDIPLFYIIRPDVAPPNISEEVEIIYNEPLVGARFKLDNQKVHQILTKLTTGTDASQWIKDHRRNQDGQGAWKNLCNHYNGSAEGDKRVTAARHNIKIITHNNEGAFTFEKYPTRLKKAFTTLSVYEQPKSEKEKVEILLSQINTNNVSLTTSLGICRDRHNHTYEDACTSLYTQIAIIFPQHQPNAHGRGGRGGRQPRYRGVSAVHKKAGKTTFNGVDISDTTKFFSRKDFQKMGNEGRTHLAKCPKRKKARENYRSGKKYRGNDSGQTESQQQIAAIITGVMQARNSDTVLASNVTPTMPQHGPHSRATNVSTVTTATPQAPRRYDHIGNICKVTSGPRRTVSLGSSGKIMVRSDKVMPSVARIPTCTEEFRCYLVVSFLRSNISPPKLPEGK